MVKYIYLLGFYIKTLVVSNKIKQLYSIFSKEYRLENWWRSDSIFEIILGTILTQNTSWSNVEKSILKLKGDDVLNAKSIYDMDTILLEEYIRSSGYYRQKTKKIKIFLEYFKRYDFSIERLKSIDKDILRDGLLNLWGIGAETADSILCYALDKESFVIDTYTKRLFYRLGIVDKNVEYVDIQNTITNSIEKNVLVYKNFHAQIVIHSKEYCLKTPQCENCFLSRKYSICNY